MKNTPKISPPSAKTLFSPILKAREKRLDWVELAKAVSDIKRSSEARTSFPTKEDFWDAAARSTGYSRNALQRMESTLRRIRQIEQESQSAIKECLGLKRWSDDALLKTLDHFPKAELFARIHRLEPAEAWGILKRMRSEKLSVARLKEKLRDITNSDPRAQSFATTPNQKQVIRERLALVEMNKAELYATEAVNLYFQQYRFSLVSADAIALSCNEDGGIEFIDAFLIVSSIAKKSDEGFADLLSGIDFKTSFFRHVWLFLSDPSDIQSEGILTPLDRLINAIDQLGISRVGILTVMENSEFRVLRRPKGTEKPSRYQATLTEIMRHGVPDFGAV